MTTTTLTPERPLQRLGARTAAGGAIAIGAQAAGMVAQLVYVAIMARLLSPQDFGLVAMAATITSFIMALSDLGLTTATIQQATLSGFTVNTLFRLNIGVGILLMLLICVTAPAASWIYGDPRILGLVLLSSIVTPITAAGLQHKALLTREMRWLPLHGAALASQIAGFVCGILAAAVFRLGYWSLLAAQISTALFATVCYWRWCRWRPGRDVDWGEARNAVKFALNLSGFQLMNYLHRQGDNVLIGYQLGATELGFYTRAYTLLMLPLTMINVPIGTAVLPALSRCQNDLARWRTLFLDSLALVTLASSFVTTVLFILAEPLVVLVFGPSWSASIEIFGRLSVSMLISAPCSAIGLAFLSLGRADKMFRWSLFAVPITLLFFAVGVQTGAASVAAAYSTAVFCLAPPFFWFVCKKPASAGEICS